MTDADTTPPVPAAPPTRRRLGRRIGRRAFLGAGIATVALASLAAAGARFGAWTRLRWKARGLENHARAYSWAFLPPAERIRRHYDYLTLDDADVARFVADFERAYGKVELGAVEANRLLYTRFLLSTDFFVHGADEARPVRYVALHDPYVSPCWNPLAPTA